MSEILIAFVVGASAASVGLAWLLRRLGAPAAGVLAGICIGLALGPTLLGRLAPDWYEIHISGGQDERIALEKVLRRNESDRIARDQLGATPQFHLDAVIQAQQQETALRTKWHDATRSHRTPLALGGAIVAAAFFLFAGFRRPRATGPRPDWYATLSVGLWSAVLPGCVILAVLRLLEYEWVQCAWASTAVGIGGVVYRISDLHSADEVEHGGSNLMSASARVASLVAVGVVVSIAVSANLSAFSLTITLASAGAILVGYFFRGGERFTAFSLTTEADPCVEQFSWHDAVFMPIMSALVTLHLEVFEHFAIWPLLAALIISGDGRWLGVFLGAMLCGARQSLRTMRLALAAMSAGSSQLAMTLLGLSTFILPEPIALALLASVFLMELTTGARRRLAEQIEDAEEQLRASEDD